MKLKPHQYIYVVVFVLTLYYAYNYNDFKTVSTHFLKFSAINQSSVATEGIKNAHFKTRVEESTICKYCDVSLKCQLWTNSTLILRTFRGKTKIKTKNDKFLLPLLYNGPFNQLSGFRQSVYAAISLNRTLVLPIFTKHFTDEADKSIIDPNYRFDVANIASILPIVTFNEYAQKCGKKVDVIFAATSIKSTWAIERFHEAEKFFGINLLKKKYLPKNATKVFGSIKEYPVIAGVLPDTMLKGRARFLIKSRESVNKMFGSKKKCAMYAFPFNELDFQNEDLVMGNSDITDVENVSDRYLLDKIVDATQVPEYISEIAKLFIHKQFDNNSFYAMHWRFDKEDFFEFMCQPNGNGQKNVGKVKKKLQEKCDKIFNSDPSTFPYLIRQYLSNKAIEIGAPVIIYIAAPDSTLDWLLSGTITHQKRYDIKFYTSRDVVQFLHDENIFKRCDFFMENLNDIISLIDMELCIHGQIFFRSLLSSWSNEVMNSRRLHSNNLPLRNYDIGIFDVITSDG